MKQQVVFEKPQAGNKSVADIKPGKKTVKALSLLTKQEQRLVPKMAAFIVIEHQEQYFTVPIHAHVPWNATISRSQSGALRGIEAVVGG